jgi:GNAT superfamily N-acetyltransferase
MYRFQLADTDDEEIVQVLKGLHDTCFEDTAPDPGFEHGWWWIGHNGRELAAFCGLTESTIGPGVGYLKRAGVLRAHRGQGLQRRMLRLRERKARSLGFTTTITDTTDNVHSANNLIAAGYFLFEGTWAFPHSLYWRKHLDHRSR